MAQVPLAPPPQTGGPLDGWLYLLWRRLTQAGQILWSTIAPGTSANVAAAVTDETGSPGSLVFSGNPTLAGVTNSGDLTFIGTGNRIKGLFSGIPIADRIGFQTTEAATYTSLQVIPSSGGVGGFIFANALPDVANTHYVYIGATTGACQFVSNKTGTGTLTPMTFLVGSIEYARIDTTGIVTLGYLSTSPTLKIIPDATPSTQRSINLTAGAAAGNPTIGVSGGKLACSAALVLSQTTLLETSVALTNGAGASAGTLLNAPAVGNPTKWIPINDNGTTRYIPAW